jgi:hypothetical protein
MSNNQQVIKLDQAHELHAQAMQQDILNPEINPTGMHDGESHTAQHSAHIQAVQFVNCCTSMTHTQVCC